MVLNSSKKERVGVGVNFEINLLDGNKKEVNVELDKLTTDEIEKYQNELGNLTSDKIELEERIELTKSSIKRVKSKDKKSELNKKLEEFQNRLDDIKIELYELKDSDKLKLQNRELGVSRLKAMIVGGDDKDWLENYIEHELDESQHIDWFNAFNELMEKELEKK